MRRGSSQDTPMSQPDRPSRTKAVPNLAAVVQMRMSEARAKANPPPAHGPLMAEITGWRRSRSRGTRVAMNCWTAMPCCGGAEVLGAGDGAEAVEVEPGAEAASGPGEDDGAAVMVGVDGLQRLVEVPHQLVGERIELVRPIEGDLGDLRCRPAQLDGGEAAQACAVGAGVVGAGVVGHENPPKFRARPGQCHSWA